MTPLTLSATPMRGRLGIFGPPNANRERVTTPKRSQTSARLSDLEYVAFGIVPVADLGAFEFPLALGDIQGTA